MQLHEPGPEASRLKVMYLDESGNHSLSTVEPNFPVFVLGGVILERNYVFEVVEPRLSALKLSFFGRDDFALHTAEIVRPKGQFSVLKDDALKLEFVSALTELMRELEYTVVACAVLKMPFRRAGHLEAEDLYLHSLEFVVEQFCAEVGEGADAGLVYAERRRPDLDRELETSWDSMRRLGNRGLPSTDLSRRILELVLKDKRTRTVGLELADLVVSPIGRAMAGYDRREDWDVVESKFRRVGGSYFGSGLVILPKEKEAGDR
jgi:hypothetical protein